MGLLCTFTFIATARGTQFRKLSSDSIGWQKQKKKMKLAAQIFSALVADSLKFSEHD